MVALGGLYGVGALAVAIAAIFADVDEFVSGFVLWGTMWLVPGVPCATAIAVVGWRTERAISGTTVSANPVPRAWAWWLLCVGILTAFHWAALGPWAPALMGAAILQPNRADDYVPLAMFALVPWLLAAGGMILALGGRRLMTLHDRTGPRVPFTSSALVPTSAAVGTAYALSIALPAAVWLTWLESAWYRGAGATGVLGWALMGIAVAMLAGGATGAWLVAAAPVAAWTTGRARLRQLEVAGAVFAAHWVGPFVFGLSPLFRQNDDLRYVVLWLSSTALIGGTAVWSFARTWRTREAAPPSTAGAPTPS